MRSKIIVLSVVIVISILFIQPISVINISRAEADCSDQNNTRAVSNPDIQISFQEPTGTIDISQNKAFEENFVDYTVQLSYNNGIGGDLDVLISIINPSDLTVKILQGSSETNDPSLTLSPNVEETITVRVIADEHEYPGIYYMTFKVMDGTGFSEYNCTDFNTTVEQYYDLEITSNQLNSYSRIIDPNTMTDVVQTEEFSVLVENHGNGKDTVELKWYENKFSPDYVPFSWDARDDLVEIFEQDGTKPIEEIEVPAFDKQSNTPGTVTLIVNINIPKDEVKGRFWFDIAVISSAPQSYINFLQREDFQVEVNYTFQIEVVFPDLEIDYGESELLKADGTTINDLVDTIYTGDTIIVKVHIMNTGTGGIDDVEFEIGVNFDNIPLDMSKGAFDIEQGMSKEIIWNFTTTDYGMYFIKFVIDPENKILGDQQNNNQWTQYLQVKERPGDKQKRAENFLNITTQIKNSYTQGDLIVIEGTVKTEDLLLLSMSLEITFPDNHRELYIDDMESSFFGTVEYKDDCISLELDSDGDWRLEVDTTKQPFNKPGEYEFNIIAEEYSWISSDEHMDEDSITIIVSKNTSDISSKDDDDEAKQLSIGLFSYDIMAIVAIMIILFLIILFVIKAKKSKDKTVYEPAYLQRSSPPIQPPRRPEYQPPPPPYQPPPPPPPPPSQPYYHQPQPPPAYPSTFACPHCGGQVAYGAFDCPNCRNRLY